MLLPHRVTKLAAKNRSSRRIWRYCVFMVFKVVLWLVRVSKPLLLFSSSPHLLLVLNRELQISVGTAGPQLRVPELSGHCRTNREYQSHSSGRCRISTASAKPSGHCQTSTASARSIIFRISLQVVHLCTTERRAIAWEKPFKHHVRHAVQTTA